jgi:murein DD-endopeptidase MepM/ murein hydrolase activator NlpD
MHTLKEPVKELFTSSKLLILDFKEIPENISLEENIQTYFEACEAKGIDPRKPKNRQRFNGRLLTKANVRYLVSRYGENRVAMLTGSQIAKEDRTLHLGVDIFCKELEIVYAPCDGTIVRIGQELEDHSFGYYLILQPDDAQVPYIFFGHLSSEVKKPGKVKAGDPIAKLGDYIKKENGGWSRHLHLQMLKTLPERGQAPIGYSTPIDITVNRSKFPDPMHYFTQWRVSK